MTQKNRLQHALLATLASVAACTAEPPLDAAQRVPVAGGNLLVDLVGRPNGACDVRVRGNDVSNWVKANGVVSRPTLAPAIVQACTGRLPYLASVSGQGDDGATVWEESAGPDSGRTTAAYRVSVASLRSDEAILQLRLVTLK